MKALLNIFNRKYKPGSIFAYRKGLYCTKMIVLVDSTKQKMSFLMLPDMIPHNIDSNEFYINIKMKHLDFIEVLPNYVFDVVKAQYLKSIHAA